MFKKNVFAIVPLILFVSLSVILWRGLQLDPHKLPSTLINKNMPQFYLPDLSSPQHYISEKTWLGAPALINVWASWCISCIADHALLTELAKKEHLTIYGINYKDDPTDARTWLKEHGNPYKMIVMDRVGKTAIDWGVYGTPETFIIDAKGLIRYKRVGVLSPELIRDEIMPVMKKLKLEARKS